MNGRRRAVLLPVCLVVASLTATLPNAHGQGDDGLPGTTFASVLAPDGITPLAGGIQRITIEATIALTDPDVTVRLVTAHGADVVPAGPMTPVPEAPSTFTGSLGVPFDTPPGTYTLRLEATAAAANVASFEQPFSVASLAAIEVAQDTVDFGEAAPNNILGPVRIDVANAGNVRIDGLLSATAMTHEDGSAAIGADRLRATGPTGVSATLDDGWSTAALDVGDSVALELTLHIPAGATQYVPPGTYAGTLDVSATEVRP